MRCAWDAYIRLLPPRLRDQVDKMGRRDLQELRLRIGLPPELVTARGSLWLSGEVQQTDISFIINTASRYSPWATDTAAKGYVTAPGGHRIGICGDAIINNGVVTGIRTVTSLCIRVARDIPGIAQGIPIHGSILIIGRPGSGKTTLLRDLIRHCSDTIHSVSVVDERGELFPVVNGTFVYPRGRRTDVITGCTKRQGIESVLRCMSPGVIAVDEITADEDCSAMVRAGKCGVYLYATAHASSAEELYARPIYRSIVKQNLFDTLIILQQDKSWKMERINI